MTEPFSQYLGDEAETVSIAARLAVCLPLAGATIFLAGELGAGKTTFCRGVLRAMGHEGAVKSPTFTLVEPYEIEGRQVFHFDLYRLNDPGELEYLGVDDYLDGQHLCLIEWPERGAGSLPIADLEVMLQVEGAGRRLTIDANSNRGERVIRELLMQTEAQDRR